MNELQPGDRILAARPQNSKGPGWHNQPLWVYYMRNGVVHETCLQPDEQTPTMAVLFDVLEAAQNEMIREIERVRRARWQGESQ